MEINELKTKREREKKNSKTKSLLKKIDKLVARLRERHTQNTSTCRNGTWNITADHADSKKVIRGHYRPYTQKSDNLHDMNYFLEQHKLSELTQ